MPLSSWMSWEQGISLVARTDPDLPMANLVLFLARSIHTPVGSAPAALVYYQADELPLVAGFAGPDRKIAAWLGRNLFSETNFENALSFDARIEVEDPAERSIDARLEVVGHSFAIRLRELGELCVIQRDPSAVIPFNQQGLEAAAEHADLTLDGEPLALHLPAVGLTAGPAAAWCPAGIYSR